MSFAPGGSGQGLQSRAAGAVLRRSSLDIPDGDRARRFPVAPTICTTSPICWRPTMTGNTRQGTRWISASGPTASTRLIGHCEYAWHFIGADIAPAALASARAIVTANPQLASGIELRQQANALRAYPPRPAGQRGAYRPDPVQPPFHASADEASSGSTRKWRNLGKLDPQRKSHRYSISAGRRLKLWCPGGEAAFLKAHGQRKRAGRRAGRGSAAGIEGGPVVNCCKAGWPGPVLVEVRILGMTSGSEAEPLVAWTFKDGQARSAWRQPLALDLLVRTAHPTGRQRSRGRHERRQTAASLKRPRSTAQGSWGANNSRAARLSPKAR